MKNLFFLILVICFQSYLLAQSDSSELQLVSRNDKNAIYGNVGSVLAIWSATVYYERKFSSLKFTKHKKQKEVQFSPFARVGCGGLAWVLDDEWLFITSQFGVLVGGGPSFFEASLGLIYNFDNYVSSNFEPSFNLGYRKQKQGSRFIFRTGISYPETIYFGFGYSF